jgi:YVTN family beta-propeller protein
MAGYRVGTRGWFVLYGLLGAAAQAAADAPTVPTVAAAPAAPASPAAPATPAASADHLDSPVPATATLAVEHRWTVGGDGGWDYLTFRAPYLFISRGTRVDIFDPRRGAVVASIPNTPGVHGIALAPDMNLGFSSNGQGDSVTAFNLATLTLSRAAPVSGHNPDAIVYDPAGRHVFTFNGKSRDVSVLDAATLAVLATLKVPDKPEFAVLDEAAGKIYDNIESESGQLAVIDTRKLAVETVWPLPGCSSPSGLAIDLEHHRLFSACDNKVMAVTDARTGKAVARVPIGESPDAAAFDPGRGLVFVSNGEGTLTVVRELSADRYQVAATVQTQLGARTMALDPATGTVYLVTAKPGPTPAPTAERPHPRPTMVPGSFTILAVGSPRPASSP